jgi:hypothetical protein
VPEIKIQRGQRSPWGWITGIILLAGFIWFILAYVYPPGNNDNEMLIGDTMFSGQWNKSLVDTVNEVSEFINYTMDTTNSSSAKKYTEQGLIKLQSALGYLADNVDSTNDNVKANIDFLDKTIVKIDTSSKYYLTELKSAFSASLKVIESIQQLNYPGMADKISNLRTTESGIDVRKSISGQLDRITLYFVEVGKTLENMKL